MNVKLILGVFALMLLGGCATHQYDWGNYDGKLYKFYKDPTTAEEFRVALKAHIDALDAKGVKPAPGLYAELGTLFLEKGDDKTAIAYYAKERDAWRESKYLMDAMIAAIGKRAKPEGK